MKRILIAVMVVGVVAGTVVTAEAKKKRTRVERTVEGAYAGPWVPFGNWDCSDAPTGGRGCVTITTRSVESHLSAKVRDAHGQPVRVMVWSEYNASNSSPLFYGSFCGETTAPISFPPGVTLKLWIGYFDPALPSCGIGLATTGTISVTLSNLP